MALTVTINNQDNFGNKRGHGVAIDFDSSYPTGGESLTPAMCGLMAIDQILFESAQGYTFDYDYVNQKIVISRPAPPIVFEEVVTITSNVGYLRYPAAFIHYVALSGTGATPFLPVISGITPTTGQVAVDKGWNFTTGAFTKNQRCKLTFAAGDAVAEVVVTYITQSWATVTENMRLNKFLAGALVYGGVATSVITTGTPDKIKLKEVAAAIGMLVHYDTSAYTPFTPNYKGSTAATTESLVDFTDAADSNLTTLTAVATDAVDGAGHIIYVEYIKLPSAGMLFDGFVEEDDLTPSSDVATLAKVKPLIFGTMGCFPGATTKFAKLIGKGATISTTATAIQPTSHVDFIRGTTWGAATFTLGSGHTDTDHLKPSYVHGNPNEIAIIPCQIPDSIDLSRLTDVRALVIGS
jgi:hypothetical protein